MHQAGTPAANAGEKTSIPGNLFRTAALEVPDDPGGASRTQEVAARRYLRCRLGGHRVPDSATAFGGRSAGFTFNIMGNTASAEGFADQRQWARDYWTALAPFHTGAYVNFLMEEGNARVQQSYGSEKYGRLIALESEYDPTNFFRLNQNIPPG